VLLKLLIYGHLNRIPSNRGPERKISGNVEVMWLIGRLTPAHKTVVDVRRDSGRLSANLCAIHPAMPPDWRADPFSGALYVFRAKRADRVKIVW
jgi:hypothetical protein